MECSMLDLGDADRTTSPHHLDSGKIGLQRARTSAPKRHRGLSTRIFSFECRRCAWSSTHCRWIRLSQHLRKVALPVEAATLPISESM